MQGEGLGFAFNFTPAFIFLFLLLRGVLFSSASPLQGMICAAVFPVCDLASMSVPSLTRLSFNCFQSPDNPSLCFCSHHTLQILLPRVPLHLQGVRRYVQGQGNARHVTRGSQPSNQRLFNSALQLCPRVAARAHVCGRRSLMSLSAAASAHGAALSSPSTTAFQCFFSNLLAQVYRGRRLDV